MADERENPYGNPLPYGLAPVSRMRPAAFYDGNAFRARGPNQAPLVQHAANWKRDFFAQVYAATEAADPDLMFYTVPDPTLGARPAQYWQGDDRPAWYSTTAELTERPFMRPGRGFCGAADEVLAAQDAQREIAPDREALDRPFELPQRTYEVPSPFGPQRLLSLPRGRGLPPAPIMPQTGTKPRVAPGRPQYAFGPARQY